MKKIIAMGGCHVTGGDRTKIFNTQGIFIDKKIPYRLCDKSDKSLKILDHYLKFYKDDEVLIVLQIGNKEFVNALQNLVNTKPLRKIIGVFSKNIASTHEKKTEIQPSLKNRLAEVLKLVFYIAIIPFNFITISLKYIHKLFELNKTLKNYDNVNHVILITPFYSNLHFNWIFRKYCVVLCNYIFNNNKLYNIIDAYTITKSKAFLLNDGLHLNDFGLKTVGEVISTGVNSGLLAKDLHPTM